MRNSLTPAVGMRLIIGDNRMAPNIASKGISVRPGTETHIGLRKATITRLKSPYQRNCTSQYDDPNIQVHHNPIFAYSSKRCKSICIQTFFQKKCGCRDATITESMMLEEHDAVTGSNVRYCDYKNRWDSEDIICVQHAQLK